MNLEEIKTEQERKEQFEKEYDEVIDFVSEALDLNNTEEDIATELYTCELNYNNGDTTSGQRVWSYEQVCKLVGRIITYLKNDPDHCSSCGRTLGSEDYISEPNSVPYGDTWVDEMINTGYVCSCGHEESW